jgi:hypothetical protein
LVKNNNNSNNNNGSSVSTLVKNNNNSNNNNGSSASTSVKNNNNSNNNNGSSVSTSVKNNNNSKNNNGSSASTLVKNNNNSKNNANNKVSTNANNTFPSFKPSINKTKLTNAMKRTDTQVKAKTFMHNVVSNQLINVKDMKTINGNKIYYKNDENGVRPILIFIKASSDSLNKSNLNILANVLLDKMPNTRQQPVSNKFTYIFTESGPFGSGYYHNGYFTTENNNKPVTMVNNPLFENNRGSSSLKELTLDELIQQMRLRNNNTMFDNYTLASKTNRVRDLTKLVNRLQKKNKSN